jgi:hypothetical protein
VEMYLFIYYMSNIKKHFSIAPVQSQGRWRIYYKTIKWATIKYKFTLFPDNFRMCQDFALFEKNHLKMFVQIQLKCMVHRASSTSDIKPIRAIRSALECRLEHVIGCILLKNRGPPVGGSGIEE